MQNRAFLCVRVVEMVVEKYFPFTSSPNFAFFLVVLLQHHKELGPRHVGVKHQVPRSIPCKEPVVSGPLDSQSLPVRWGVIRDRILGPLILGHHLIKLLLCHVLVSFQLTGYISPEAIHVFPKLGEPVHYVSVVGRHAPAVSLGVADQLSLSREKHRSKLLLHHCSRAEGPPYL